MTQSCFREPTSDERQIVDRLLELPFPGRDELRKQVVNARVRTIDEYGDTYGSMEFCVTASTGAPVEQRVPVMAVAYDADGVPIEFLLHVVDGRLQELEVVKMDGSGIVQMPSSWELEVRAHSVPERLGS